MDRSLIARIVERELYRSPSFRGNWSALEREARISHSTVARLKRGDDRVSTSTLRKIEAVLDLPMDTLATAGMGDFDVLPELGVQPDLTEWILQVTRQTGNQHEGLLRSADKLK